jgi:hypothetical protein
MSAVATAKVAFVSAMAGVALLVAGFLVSSSLAGAQTPPEQTPAPQTEPADPGQTPRGDKEECDENRDGGSGTGSGVRSRGGVSRSFSQ